jgi:small subunit ribosomal protein S9
MSKKEQKYYFGTGRRKTATARVRIFENSKTFSLNGKDFIFSDPILSPFEVVGKKGIFGITVVTHGGGKKSQDESVRHGISRALVQYNSEFRMPLKKAGYLRRDPREVERKKPGLKKARRSPQWSKR